MANHSATKKDVRQAAKRRERNKYYGKTTRNAIRDLKAAKGKEASDKLPEVLSMIDKLAKRGVIHKNKAANLKSKLTKKKSAKNIPTKLLQASSIEEAFLFYLKQMAVNFYCNRLQL